LNAEIYVADGDYIKDIEINDLRNRYTLTKGSTQKMVNTPLSLADIPAIPLKGDGYHESLMIELLFPSLCDWMKLTLHLKT
jgi:hypothetical protein